MAVDSFLKIDGIKGESQDHKHKDEIDVISWSWGASNPSTASTGGGLGAGKVSFQDLHFSHYYDKSSAPLMLACANGTHIKEIKLYNRKQGKDQQEYLTVTLSDCLITNCQVSDGGTSQLPIEQVGIAYSKVAIEYKAQKPDGTLDAPVKMGWDVKQNKAV
ncbi:MAG: type VI secretion system tube protein Hcp [Rhodocyclaceae bacterium]|nr:type VI secretion system tube protein Hcp [Rhodocyclaceae bacterium]MBX3668202.1 type VI secretion system tube protein Hcp [Rhodocyclaceae bacterium]